jgi:hypothetical protein
MRFYVNVERNVKEHARARARTCAGSPSLLRERSILKKILKESPIKDLRKWQSNQFMLIRNSLSFRLLINDNKFSRDHSRSLASIRTSHRVRIVTFNTRICNFYLAQMTVTSKVDAFWNSAFYERYGNGNLERVKNMQILEKFSKSSFVNSPLVCMAEWKLFTRWYCSLSLLASLSRDLPLRTIQQTS